MSLALRGSALLQDVSQVAPSPKHWKQCLSHFLSKSVWDHTCLETARQRIALDLLGDCIALAVDSTALVKRGKKFERISKVYDSRDGKIHDGFPLLVATGVTEQHHYAPISWHRYSDRDLDVYSENQIKMQFIEDTYVLFPGETKPVFIGDSGFCRKHILVALIEQDIPYMVRTVTRRVRLPSHEVVLTSELPRGVHDVQVATQGWRSLPTTVVVGGWDKEKKVRLVLMTNLPREEYSHTKLLKLYEKRWYVEETIKQMKQYYGIESFRVRSWLSGERFLTLAFLAATVMSCALKKHRRWIQRVLPQFVSVSKSFTRQKMHSVYYCRQMISKLLFCGLITGNFSVYLPKLANAP